MGRVANEISRGRLPLSEADLRDWLDQARKGYRLEYHTGFLATDVSPETSRLTETDRVELVRVAGRARRAADEGMVVLVQKRLGPELFSYFAIARQRPKPMRASITAAEGSRT